ncbi:beta-lactamase family protein [bacterium]|nr:beta-lactamase family protein [bacterium]
MNKIDSLFEQALADGVFPGASVLVLSHQKIVFEKVYGLAQKEPIERALTPHLFFDIASLTKPIATATLFMKAVERKLCSLHDPLSKYFSKANPQITLAHLLNHSSGLAAYKEYEKESHPADIKQWMTDKIVSESLENPVGTKVVYSDLGYLLLGFILEKIFSLPLDVLFKNEIANPLKLNLFYNPISKPLDKTESHFVATELCPLRNKILLGEAMDERCYLLNGVAGHAGLFGTARDVAGYLIELRKVEKGESTFVNPAVLKTFLTKPASGGFTLGFDTPSFPSSSGKYFSELSVGHLGYTGTSFWWDRKKDFSVILLTNRIHPTRINEAIKKFRPKAHDVIVENLHQ